MKLTRAGLRSISPPNWLFEVPNGSYLTFVPKRFQVKDSMSENTVFQVLNELKTNCFNSGSKAHRFIDAWHNDLVAIKYYPHKTPRGDFRLHMTVVRYNNLNDNYYAEAAHVPVRYNKILKKWEFDHQSSIT